MTPSYTLCKTSIVVPSIYCSKYDKRSSLEKTTRHRSQIAEQNEKSLNPPKFDDRETEVKQTKSNNTHKRTNDPPRKKDSARPATVSTSKLMDKKSSNSTSTENRTPSDYSSDSSVSSVRSASSRSSASSRNSANSRSSASSRSSKSSRRSKIRSSIELVPGYGVMVNKRKVDSIYDRYHTKPRILERKLYYEIVGKDKLANYSLTGRGKTTAIPDNIFDSIERKQNVADLKAIRNIANLGQEEVEQLLERCNSTVAGIAQFFPGRRNIIRRASLLMEVQELQKKLQIRLNNIQHAAMDTSDNESLDERVGGEIADNGGEVDEAIAEISNGEEEEEEEENNEATAENANGEEDNNEGTANLVRNRVSNDNLVWKDTERMFRSAVRMDPPVAHAEEIEGHYVLITSMDALLNSQISKNGHKLHLCDGCYCRFRSKEKLEEHIPHCDQMNGFTRMRNTSIYLDKPVYVGLSILDISKRLMYDFHYDIMRNASILED
ncbi:unnamed protein product [Trichogramma brassicae]|uniref:C2H2-type domain-containing protein n=1 Tax=Trichogramma brassicae TaxID=86971 RepID=A0A6H5IUR6_9HYME|nr:unnamed protein product [Trichogramma brassicae]